MFRRSEAARIFGEMYEELKHVVAVLGEVPISIQISSGVAYYWNDGVSELKDASCRLHPRQWHAKSGPYRVEAIYAGSHWAGVGGTPAEAAGYMLMGILGLDVTRLPTRVWVLTV